MKTRTLITLEGGMVKNQIDLPDGKYYADILSTDVRSGQQNRYYQGIVIPMVQKGLLDMGTDVSRTEVHEFLKAKFNYKELTNEGTGEHERIPVSTTRLNKSGFNDYVHQIQIFASEFLNIVIPDPGTQTEMNYSALKK